LWAVLTHPIGEHVQTAVLYDARDWVFAHARRSVRLATAQQQTDALAQQARHRADELQARLATQQQQAADALRQAQAELARLRGELARARAQAASIAPPEVAVQGSVPSVPLRSVIPSEPAAEPLRGIASVPTEASAPAPAPWPPHAASAPASSPAAQPTGAVDVSGRRVLCVGGIQHAVARYRGRIEKLGGRFEHHDGGIEDGVQALEARLSRADLVLCQAACINHEACHRVKRHCERTGTPCVYLDRPSLSRLDRALACGQGALNATR
jgi:hypothetical protein